MLCTVTFQEGEFGSEAGREEGRNRTFKESKDLR